VLVNKPLGYVFRDFTAVHTYASDLDPVTFATPLFKKIKYVITTVRSHYSYLSGLKNDIQELKEVQGVQ